MGLESLSYLAAIIAAVLGGGQLVVSLFPFFRLKGQYESLQEALRGIRSPKDERYASIYGDWPALLKWLDVGALLIGPVQRRAMRQAVVGGTALVAVIATIPINPYLDKTGIKWHDLIAVAVAAIVPRLMFVRNWLLPESERKFLRYFYDLEEAFYRREVVPKLDTFNHYCPRQDRPVAWSAENTRLWRIPASYLGEGLRF
jgi:hypothetical protein